MGRVLQGAYTSGESSRYKTSHRDSQTAPLLASSYDHPTRFQSFLGPTMSTVFESGYSLTETPGLPVLDRSKSSPAITPFERSSPPVFVFSSDYQMSHPNYYGYPNSTPGSQPQYSHPVTPYGGPHAAYSAAYTTTPAPIGGHPMPLTATPTSHLSVQRPYTAHGYGQTTAAPSVLFRQPLSLYGSPSSTISALPHDKDLAHTPPPLDLCRRNSEASIYDQTMPYYLPPGHSNLFAPPYMPGSDYASIRPDGHIKKRSRTAQACEKCRIRKAKCSGGHPCTRCINKKLPCVFSGPTRARGAARYKGEHLSVDAAAQAARLRARRHSLDDPFATPTAAQPIREIRRHSEGSVESRLVDDTDSNSSALGLDLTPQLSQRDDISRPASSNGGMSTMPAWTPLTTPMEYYTVGQDSFPWTVESSPAVSFQHRYSMPDIYSHSAPMSAGGNTNPSFQWHGTYAEA